MYKKVSVEEELPPINEFVTCFYENGETMVYKRIQPTIITLSSDNLIDPTWTWAWTMRDGIADRTPEEGKITHWLKEVREDYPSPRQVIDLNNPMPIDIVIGSLSIETTSSWLKLMIQETIKTN